MMNICPQIHYQKADSPSGGTIQKTKVNVMQILEEGKRFVDIPERNFFIEGDFVCSTTISGIKQIDRWKSWGDTQNTLARELALRIKRTDSPIFAYQTSIQYLEKLVLFYAGNPKTRSAIRGLKERYREFLEMIEDGNMDKDLEETAKKFYQDFQREVGLRGKAEEAIHKFSWSGEEKYKNWKYCCHSWMIAVCIMGMMK